MLGFLTCVYVKRLLCDWSCAEPRLRGSSPQPGSSRDPVKWRNSTQWRRVRELTLHVVLTVSEWVIGFLTVSALVRAPSWFNFPIYITKSGGGVREWHCCVWRFGHQFMVKAKNLESGFNAWRTVGNVFVHRVSCLIQYFSTFWWLLRAVWQSTSLREHCILSHTHARTRGPCVARPRLVQRLIWDQTEAYKVRGSISNEEAHLRSH